MAVTLKMWTCFFLYFGFIRLLAIGSYVKTPSSLASGGFLSTPCAARRAVFPPTLDPPLALPRSMPSRGFVLPEEGNVRLPEATFEIFSDETNSVGEMCSKGDNVYRNAINLNWTDPKNWQIVPQPDNWLAIPNSDRIPCQADEVQFPAEISLAVELPITPQFVRVMNVSGQVLTQSQWSDLVSMGGTDQLSFVLNDDYTSNGLGVSIAGEGGCMSDLRDDWSCPCQPQAEDMGLFCPSDHCDPPNCTNAVLPHGFCCPLCGGFVLLEILGQKTTSAAVRSLEATLARGCKKALAAWSVTIRAAAPHSDNPDARVLQVSVVEKQNGAGKTCINHVMDAVYKDDSHLSVAYWWKESIAGPAYSGGISGPWLVCSLLVLLGLVGLFWQCRKDRILNRLRDILNSYRLRHSAFDGLYVRFHNLGARVGAGDQREDSAPVPLDPRRDSNISYTRLSPLPNLKKRGARGKGEDDVKEADRGEGSGDLTAQKFSELVIKDPHLD